MATPDDEVAIRGGALRDWLPTFTKKGVIWTSSSFDVVIRVVKEFDQILLLKSEASLQIKSK